MTEVPSAMLEHPLTSARSRVKSGDKVATLYVASAMDQLLTKTELARFLRVSTRTIDNYRARGLISAIKIGARVLFERDRVMEQLRELEESRDE